MKLFKFIKGELFLILSITLLFSNCLRNSFQNLNTNKVESLENSKLSGGIFMVENLEKHRKSRINSENFSKSKTEFRSKNGEIMNKNLSLNNLKNDISETKHPLNINKSTPILYHSWVKYFKYYDRNIKINSPKEFVKNPDFYQQMKNYPGADFTKTNDDGDHDFIRNENYFYLSIFRDSFVFNSSKKIKMQRIHDSFNIADIESIYEDPSIKKGGIIDFGNFDEGYCIRFSTKDSKRTIYVLCFDSLKIKTDIQTMVRAIKIEQQHKEGILLDTPLAKENKDTLQNTIGKHDGKVEDTQNKTPKDGYWIILQNWSQCNLKCGGGTSTLHRMCVPPKNGGRPCKGEDIIHKSCNTHPCPNTNETNEKFDSKNSEILKPIIKIMSFTNSPQRYTKCKIKESDMMIYFKSDDPNLFDNPILDGKKIEGKSKDISIPARVIMNNSTLTIYSGDHFETMYQTYNLKFTNFIASIIKKGCFNLREKKKTVTLCPFGCENNNKVLQEWAIDFDLFKNKCERRAAYDPKADHDLQKKIQDKMDAAKQAAIDEHKRETQQAHILEKEGDLEGLVKKTNNIALQAIQREVSLEDLIRQEEEEKNREEEERIRKLIEAEKKKKNCVLKAIVEKKRENEYSLKTLQTQKKIETIKKEAAAQVMSRRNKLKKLLQKIREQSMLKRNQLKQQLFDVRNSIADELGKAYKKGETKKCADAMKSETSKINYCLTMYPDDFSGLEYCKKTEEFCNMCCTSEFGDMFQKEKEECIEKVCSDYDEEEPEKSDGRWVWHDDHK